MAAVAHNYVRDDVHPLLRHPRPIKRDSAKAQRMLGLLADDEEKLKALQREKSVTTRWLERPMYEHLEASNMESEKEEAGKGPRIDSIHEEKIEENDEDLLDRWTNPDRPLSFNSEPSINLEQKTRLDTSFVKRRPDPINCPRPISYNAQHLLSPEWTASPVAMSPNAQRPRPISLQPNSRDTRQSSFSSNSSLGSSPRLVHPQPWAASPTQYRGNARGERPVSFQSQSFAPLASPMANEPRPRPTSFATYSHQRNRSSSKIASSRGLRNNSYPNFSRPISEIAPRVVPGENMENDMVYQRFLDREAGPPAASSRIHNALNGFEPSVDKDKAETKPKKRWSTIPTALKNFARRRSSAAAQEPPKFEVKAAASHQIKLAENNTHYCDHKGSQGPLTPKSRLSSVDLLPTPVYSPVDIKTPLIESSLPLPFAPWADCPPSPAVSTDQRRGSGTSSLSPTRRTAPSRLSIESVPQMRPVSLHSHRSSVVLPSPTGTASQQRLSTIDMPCSPRVMTPRRGTPALERTCIICKVAKPPSDFTTRRITANCWHEPATCLDCLQSWIESCLVTQGLDRCTCPECGENMAFEDVGAFANTAKLG
ncbi:hypothetical protein BKA66DRAFT_162246 [Pyrenochaeta sp. MPI-SDFR-AT-0127]|nr:hypothetical protein BKA66DRAFT_162246 [Pyrenochaeta sp. MPI-SDFR-AT-0127]